MRDLSADLRRKVVVNTRTLSAPLTGVQRYTSELCGQLGERVTAVRPSGAPQGIRGHLWEQVSLPARVGHKLLWSPANTGPLAVKLQVVTIHDLAPLDHPEWFNSKFAVWYRWLLPRLVRRAQRVIAVSEFTKSRILEIAGVEPSRVAVIPNGVSRRFFRRSAEEVAEVCKSLGIPSSRYLLSLSALEPRKNLARLLEAWSRCVRHLPADLWLVVSGAAGTSRIFRTTVASRLPPRVHITGCVPDANLPALYSGASALLYPSLYEGFGLPALEAMAVGTVPIVSSNTALPEIVGDAGMLVDPYQSEVIATAIVRVIEDDSLRQQLSARAMQRSRRFEWRRTAALTWRILRQANAL